jgi:hypothetical protein
MLSYMIIAKEGKQAVSNDHRQGEVRLKLSKRAVMAIVAMSSKAMSPTFNLFSNVPVHVNMKLYCFPSKLLNPV